MYCTHTPGLWDFFFLFLTRALTLCYTESRFSKATTGRRMVGGWKKSMHNYLTNIGVNSVINHVPALVYSIFQQVRPV
jgi:hypothetical protein